MSKWIIVLLVLLALAGGIWWYRGRGSSVATATAARGSIDVTIQTIGMLRASDSAIVRAKESGIVAQLGAVTGDLVAQGDILVLLERTPFERAVADADRRLTDAEFALQLAETHAAGSPDNEQTRLDALTAGETVDAARRVLDDAQHALDSTAILAPASGRLLDLPLKVGDSIADEQLVATIGRPSAFEIVADVDELDLPNVAPGAQARFRLDAFPGSELAGVASLTNRNIV